MNFFLTFLFSFVPGRNKQIADWLFWNIYPQNFIADVDKGRFFTVFMLNLRGFWPFNREVVLGQLSEDNRPDEVVLKTWSGVITWEGKRQGQESRFDCEKPKSLLSPTLSRNEGWSITRHEFFSNQITKCRRPQWQSLSYEYRTLQHHHTLSWFQ